MGMLVLSRKLNERIVLIDEQTGEQLAELRVARIKGSSVALATRGRADVKIMRGELIDRDSAGIVIESEVEPADEPQVLDGPCLSPLAAVVRTINARRTA